MKRNGAGRLALASGMVVVAAGLVAAPVLAEGYVNTSDAPRIEAGREIDGAAWLAGNSVSVAGTVKGDLFCAGNTVTISGVVEGDVLCAGSTLTLTGRVDGDVRLAGNSVTLDGATAGAASLAGNTVVLAEGGTVGSDLGAAAATVTVGGTVTRDARLAAGAATLSGRVGRDVDAELPSLTVTSGAAIGGHLFYVSDTDASVAPGTVQGEIRRTEPPPDPRPTTPITPARTVGSWLLGALWTVLGLVVLSLAVVLVLPRYVRRVTDATWGGVGKAALVGLLALAAVLPLTILLFVTVVGAGAALLVMAAFPLAVLLSGPLTAYLIGREILRRRTDNMLAMVAVGALLLGVAGVIPFVGFLVVLAGACVGLGLIILDLRHQFATPGYTDRTPSASSRPVTPAPYPAYAGPATPAAAPPPPPATPAAPPPPPATPAAAAPPPPAEPGDVARP